MKKKVIIIMIVLILIILVVPKVKYLNDGGTVEYDALLYNITKYHRINEDSPTGYDDGIKIEILGIQVYNDFVTNIYVKVNANEIENVSEGVI